MRVWCQWTVHKTVQKKLLSPHDREDVHEQEQQDHNVQHLSHRVFECAHDDLQGVDYSWAEHRCTLTPTAQLLVLEYYHHISLISDYMTL